jgi:hypothetical protein
MSRVRGLLPLAVGLVAVLIWAGALSACGREERRDDPVRAVDAFIVSAAIDQNGTLACDYLTPAERQAVARLGSGGCGQVLGDGRLAVGRHRITTISDLRALSAAATVDGDRAHVRLTRAGSAIEFQLVKADSAERQEFQAPATEWRIASGSLLVVPRIAGGQRS